MLSHAHGFAICGAAPAGLPLLLAMLLAGLGGSALHCGPMCGAFVVGQMTERLAAVPAARLCALTRLRGALLLSYHAGRLVTYAGLGAAAALLGSAALRLGPAPSVLLALAAVLCAASGCRRLGLLRAAPARRQASRLAGTLARIGARIDRTRPAGGFLLGVLLGFLPCGLLYAALVAAASSGAALWGAAAMGCFGLGTVPALVAVGWAGSVAAGSRRLLGGHAGGALMLVNSALLCTMAVRSW